METHSKIYEISINLNLENGNGIINIPNEASFKRDRFVIKKT